MKETKSNLEKLDHSILKILEKHPSYNPEEIILTLIYEDNLKKLTGSKIHIKELISSLSKEDIIREIVKLALKVAVSDNKFGHLRGKSTCISFLDHLKYDKVKKDKIIEYLQTNPTLLTGIAKVFAKIRYKNRNNIDIKGLDSFSSKYIKEYITSLDSAKKKESKQKVKSLNVCEENINKCREDICKGIQIKKDSVDYSLGQTMYASSNIGKTRKRQEDSVLLLRHPKNNRFKILVVADGVGGYTGGAEASRYITQSIIYWFEDLDEKDYTNIKKVSNLLEDELRSINEQIFSFGDGRGTTFVCAIVGKNDTLISSVGDSRAYITRGNELIQISRDDSLVQKYFEKGSIKTKDDMRFHYAANKVTQYIGMSPTRELFEPNMYILSNKDYDKIILVSDGVSDCLSDEQIMSISTKTVREKIAKLLVESALETTSIRKNINDSTYYFEQIPPGKDNTTAAVYSKIK